jgi:uncharacterized protein YkwD
MVRNTRIGWKPAVVLLAVLGFGCSALGDGGNDTPPAPDAGGDPLTGYPDAGPWVPPPDADTTPPPPPADAGPPPSQDDAVRLCEIINEERGARGLSQLVVRADLSCAALAHSIDIGTTETCSMVGSNGESFTDRVDACGGASASSALVGCGYFSPQGTVNGWIDMPETAEYLFDPEQAFVGCGWFNDYWTAIFDK